MHMSPPVRSYGPNRMDTTSYLPTPIRPAKSGGPLGLSWVYWAGIGAAAIGVGVLVYAYR